VRPERRAAFRDHHVALGIVLPDLARDLQQRVAGALATMCDLDMRVDISVDEIDE